LKNNFQPFLKTPKYKTIGCFDKTTVCFSLSLKSTFLLKRIENAYALDSIKSGLHIKSTQILSKISQQQQAQPSLQNPSKGFGFFKA